MLQAADGSRDLRLRHRKALDYTLFRPFNWIGAGLDRSALAKEGSSRVITQFLGHIVRGEPIKLVDGGTQKRSFTYIDDGIDALMKIIENRRRLRDAARSTTSATRPTTTRCASWPSMMLEAGRRVSRIPRKRRARCRWSTRPPATTTASGYQDVANRVPKIDNTRAELGWEPKVTMREALQQIFEAYRGQLPLASHLLD